MQDSIEKDFLPFPPGFIWGAATSAYQIEGAWDADGRGPSIWDIFCSQRGRIRTGESGETAADHYHRWAEDVELMSAIGLKAYRFSIAWTRILPSGKGAVNQAGLDFYDRLVDALLAKGITPYPTLFHYDLPQSLQDQGGWPRRETAGYFGEYAGVLAKRLGDRVTCWITHNEPMITSFLGYLTGEHAPGIRNPFAAFAAVHHVLLSHGLAVQALRANAHLPLQVGIAINLAPIYPASASSRDLQATRLPDSIGNRLFLDPLLKGRYPEDLAATWVWRLLERSVARSEDGRVHRGIQPDDLKTISQPLDFLGVNYYTRMVVRHSPFLRYAELKPVEGEYSQMWEIYPPGIYDLLVRLHRDYHHPNLVISENGVPEPDEISADGRVHDPQRIRYLEAHLAQVQRAIQDGAPVSGYFVWSLLDNFEWIYGYSRRFGLVYVDFKTKQRTLKDSARWYRDVIRANGVAAKSAIALFQGNKKGPYR
jgi:beta-glucosidase